MDTKMPCEQPRLDNPDWCWYECSYPICAVLTEQCLEPLKHRHSHPCWPVTILACTFPELLQVVVWTWACCSVSSVSGMAGELHPWCSMESASSLAAAMLRLLPNPPPRGSVIWGKLISHLWRTASSPQWCPWQQRPGRTSQAMRHPVTLHRQGM